MIGVLAALCAVILAATGPAGRRRWARRGLGDHRDALDRLGQAAGDPGDPSADRPPVRRGWIPPPPPPPERPDPAGAAPPTAPVPTAAPTTPARPDLQFSAPPERPAPAGATMQRLSRMGRPVAALAGLVVLAVVALVLTTMAGGSGSHHSRAGASRPSPAPAATVAPTTVSASTAPPTTAAPTTTTTPPPPGAPVLASITPPSAAPGQTVTLSGSNFYSPSGRITVSFGGTDAGVSCSSATTCTATVPPKPSAGPATTVTISTDAGTSRPVPFTYP